MQKHKIALAIATTLALSACGGGGNNNSDALALLALANANNPAPTNPQTPPPTDPGTPPTNPGTPDPGPTDPEPQPEPEPEAKVLLEESFDGLTALPAGWRLKSNNVGTVSVQDGSLFIDGRAHSTNMTAVLLPQSLEALSNYRIDVVFTFGAANNNGRWGSVMYRTSSDSATPVNEPYYQFAIRQNAMASNGTEFALRRAGGWNVQGTHAYGEAIDGEKTYTATVMVHGNRVRQYLNGRLTHDMSLDEAMSKGGIGLQTAGLVMRVDSVKVTEQLKALPEITKLVAVQDSGTQAAMAPTLVLSAAANQDLAASGASNLLYGIDASLNLRSEAGESLGSLAQYFAQAERRTIPVLRIADSATVDALVRFTQENDSLGDVTLLSDNVELLAHARTQLPAVRTAVDFSGSGFLGNTRQDILQVVSATNRAKAKIAILPPAMVNRATVSHLQRLLITTWARSNASSATQAADVLTTGVNGVVPANATSSAMFAKVLRALPANTLLRKPLITGHRGMPSQVDENTLEGARAAVAVGADAVENDIYMTTDGHLVIMHDTTVNRTTNGTGAIESMTLAQVQALRTKGQGHAVPTLKQFFEEFRGRSTVHFVEIKSSNAGIVPLLQKELAELDVRDQVVTISFDANQIKRMGSTLPEISNGFLNSFAGGSDPLLDLRTILNGTQQNSATFNPSYTGLSAAAMEAGKHRGITFWPWTLNNESEFYRFYSYGTNGLTTDYAWWARDFPVALSAAATGTATVGQPLSLPITLSTQVGQTLSPTATGVAAVIDGTATHSTAADGTVTFTSAGTATVLPGYRHRMGDGTYSYVIVGKPMTLTVSATPAP